MFSTLTFAQSAMAGSILVQLTATLRQAFGDISHNGSVPLTSGLSVLPLGKGVNAMTQKSVRVIKRDQTVKTVEFDTFRELNTFYRAHGVIPDTTKASVRRTTRARIASIRTHI